MSVTIPYSSSSSPAISGELPGAIGNTPLVVLRSLVAKPKQHIYAKLEMMNPSGSMKDRAAHGMITAALDHGDIKADSVVIESSSGNMGLALAQVCHHYGIRFICVVDTHTNTQNIRLMRAYNAEVIIVHEARKKGGLLQARLARVQKLVKETANSYWPNQYRNTNNPASYQKMMQEIDTALDGKIDALFCAIGTGGTIRGCKDYIDQHGLQTKLYAVDAAGSAIFGGQAGPRLLPGHGSSQRSSFFTAQMANVICRINDKQAVEGCHSLLKHENIMAGGSSGAVISALQQEIASLPEKANIVAILGDKGERYTDTIYSDNWIKNNIV